MSLSLSSIDRSLIEMLREEIFRMLMLIYFGITEREGVVKKKS